MAQRTITAALEAETISDVVMPVMFTELQFSGGTLYFWTGLGSIGWDDKTWTGTGSFGGASQMEETTQIRAAGVTLTLSAVDGSQLSVAFTQEYQGRPGKVWLGALDLVTNDLIVDPAIVVSGRMDTINIQEDGDTSTVQLNIENELADLERPREFRYTPEDHKKYFPSDSFFDYVAGIQDAVIYWGREGQRTQPVASP